MKPVFTLRTMDGGNCISMNEMEVMMEPWSTDPAVHYDMQIPKAVQNLDLEISRVDKILLENPNDPLANLLQGIHFFLTLRNQIRSTDSRNS